MRFRVMASRHSPFYTPLLACVRFLRDIAARHPYDEVVGH